MKKEITPRFPEEVLRKWTTNNLVWIFKSLREDKYYIPELDTVVEKLKNEKKHKA